MLIRSTSNPQIKYLRQLFQKRRLRQTAREFFVEGVQAIAEAYRHGWNVKRLIYCPTMEHSNWGGKTIAESNPQTHLQVTEDLLLKLSERGDPELIAIVAQADDDLARIKIQSDLLVILIEHPQNAGNLGTIIRSADAMGADGVIVIEPAVDVYDPKTVRATMGSLFALPVIRIQQDRRLQDWLDRIQVGLPRLQVVGTSPNAPMSIDRHDFTRPTILAIGKEQTGMSDDFRQRCDALVTIPMSGSADSLNSAIATSITLYEINRQRRGAFMGGKTMGSY